MLSALVLFAALAAPSNSAYKTTEKQLAAHDYSAALKDLEDHPDPIAAEWHLLASQAYEGLKDPARAREEAQDAVDMDPMDEAAHVQLAQVVLAAGDTAAAYDILSDALLMLPDSLELRLVVAQVLDQEGRYTEEVKVLRECLQKKPDFAAARQQLTVALHKLGADEKPAPHSKR